MPSLISNLRHGTLLLEVLNPLGISPCSHDFSFLWVSAILLGKSGYYLVQKIRTLQSACKIRKTFYSLVRSLIKLIAWSWHRSMHTWAKYFAKESKGTLIRVERTWFFQWYCWQIEWAEGKGRYIQTRDMATSFLIHAEALSWEMDRFGKMVTEILGVVSTITNKLHWNVKAIKKTKIRKRPVDHGMCI